MLDAAHPHLRALHAAIGHTSEGESATKVDSMTAVGFTTAQTSDCRVHGGRCEREVKLLLVVSANSLDSVERIRQTPSDESVSRSLGDVVGLMIGVVKGVSEYVFAEQHTDTQLQRSPD